ncbi:putative pentatricopeptide repeat-containing protein At3g08820 [Wolffia australiana]
MLWRSARTTSRAAAEGSEISLWNSEIRSLMESSTGTHFMALFKEMVAGGAPPATSTFSLILRGLARNGSIKLGESVHGRILKTGFAGDRIAGTALLDFYAKIGRLDSASRQFEEISDKDVVTRNAMIAALCNSGFLQEARQVFDGMPERTSATWNSIISGYCKKNKVEEAREVFDQNPTKDVISWNAMIDGYCKAGRLAAAAELFEAMGEGKNVVSWNTMITGYVHHRQFAAALELFRSMQAAGPPPTAATMVPLLSACAHLGALDMGRWVHGYVQNRRLRIDVFLGNALVDMYCKCGAIDVALKVFRGLPERNVFCWNSLISGLGMQGEGEKAMELFVEMQERERIRPDAVTFVGLLSGLSHSGMVGHGRRLFSEMATVYGVQPGVEHFGCLVDLLGRAGLLEEAMEVMETMPVKANSVIWGSLLRACKIRGDAGLSEVVARRLLEIDPGDGGNYVMLSNVYASARRWEEVLSCRMAMAEGGLRKSTGGSVIEMGNSLEEFAAGDTRHPEHRRIVGFLEEMVVDMQRMGYAPAIEAVLHDAEEK